MVNAIYYPAGPVTEEMIGLPVVNKKTQEETECVIVTSLLLLYPAIKRFPCRDGSSVKLSNKQLLELLYFLKKEREQMVSETPKTLEGWQSTGLNLEDFLSIGDEVDDDMVDYFINVVPPLVHFKSLVQVSEPFSSEKAEDGKYRNTFITFHREHDGHWHFAGACFAYESVNRADYKSHLDRVLESVTKEKIA